MSSKVVTLLEICLNPLSYHISVGSQLTAEALLSTKGIYVTLASLHVLPRLMYQTDNFNKSSHLEYLLTNILFSSGSSRRIENLFDFDQVNYEKSYAPISPTLNYQERKGNAAEPSILNLESSSIICTPFIPLKNIDSQVDRCLTNGLPMSGSELPSVGRVSGEGFASSVITGGSSEVSGLSSDEQASKVNVTVEGSSVLPNPVDLGQFFQEGHCRALEHNGCNGLTDVETEDFESSSNSQCQRLKPEDDEENDEMLGGMFTFS